VIAVLGITTILALCFISMSRLERKASRQRLNATQALLLARSGIEDVLARLASGQDPLMNGTGYAGEDWDASGALNGLEVSAEAFHRGSLNQGDCPLPCSLRPSFFRRSLRDLDAFGCPAPALLKVDGFQRGYSGKLGGDPSGTGNAYALKIEDESGKINVNGGFLDTGDRDADALPDCQDPDVRVTTDLKDTGQGWNGQLTRILNLLGSQPEVGIVNLGTDAVTRRPTGGYPSLAALQAALTTTTDLSPWITTRNWIDTKVVHPNGYPTQDAKTTFRGMNDIKKDRKQLALEEGGRPPVNLNTASRPVLQALLQGLKGTTWQGVGLGRTYQIDAATASAISGRILTRRATAPFVTWSEFSAFCDTLVDQDVITGMVASTAEFVGGGNLCGADLLKANFDPNTDLNKNLPDQILYRWIDKSDLSVWSTEGSLTPTGILRASSLGRVMASDGRLLAQRQVSVSLEAFRILRQTTQQDFIGGRTLIPSGGEPRYLSLSPGGAFGYRTTGSSLTCSWRDPAWGPDKGLAAMSYPSGPKALPAKASAVDGCIGLATVQEGNASPAQGPLMFLHHLDDSLDADEGMEKLRLAGTWDSDLQPLLTEDLWPSPAVEPNTLLPDGLHSQLARSPGFKALGNFPAFSNSGNRGVVSYWVKPTSVAIRGSWYTYNIQFSGVRVSSGLTQTLMIAASEFTHGAWGCLMENRPILMANDNNRERESVKTYDGNNLNRTTFKPGLRWRLVMAWFDTNEGVMGSDVDFDSLGVLPFLNRSQTSQYASAYAIGETEDFLAAGVAFVLGAHPQAEVTGTANQIIDEVAIYDFQDTGSGTRLLADAMASNRYKDGRYYKGDDADFLSTAILPDSGRPVRLLSARWTEYLPRENRQEILANRWSAVTILPAHGIPRLIDSRLLNSRLELSLLPAAGDLTSTPLQSLTQGGAIALSLPGFRYRVRFVNAIANPTENGVLETPFLDDITFAWQAATGPRILDWADSHR